MTTKTNGESVSLYGQFKTDYIRMTMNEWILTVPRNYPTNNSYHKYTILFPHSSDVSLLILTYWVFKMAGKIAKCFVSCSATWPACALRRRNWLQTCWVRTVSCKVCLWFLCCNQDVGSSNKKVPKCFKGQWASIGICRIQDSYCY